MNKLDLTIAAVVVIVLIIIGSVVFVSSKSAPSVPQYNVQDQEKPALELGKRVFDFGKMKLSEIKEKDIALKNTGSKPLVISGFRTSCDCTYAEVVDGGELSPRFSMHTSSDWQKAIEPNKSVTLKVYYQPSLMPVSGKVERTVFFQTNDPENKAVNINFTAEVE